jgi:chemotaxis protein MotC
MRRARGILVVAAVLAGSCMPASAGGLQPYQMIRSLQIVQDRIAGGDHAALPMQRHLLGIIDERLRAAAPEEFADARNLHALLIYGTSGGNPETLARVVSKLDLDGAERVLGEGIVHYARGDLAGARELLAGLEPSHVDPDLAAPLALVAGSLLIQQDPAGALRLFDEARLLSPGTLIEEAALRRSIPLAATLRDPERFSAASLQYVRRFLRSPYATHFAEAFVSSVIALHDAIDLKLIEEVAGGMTAEQARVIYLRIARQSAIEGHGPLLAFASRKADEYWPDPEGSDPRAVLYAGIAEVTSENAGDVLKRLEGIDERRLSASDRQLLEAARKVARTVVTLPGQRTVREVDMPQQAAYPRAGDADDGILDSAFFGSALEKLQAIDMLLGEKRP